MRRLPSGRDLFGSFTCQSCHAHEPDVAVTRHEYITGFQNNISNACMNCHPTGWEAPILPADHSLKYFPDPKRFAQRPVVHHVSRRPNDLEGLRVHRVPRRSHVCRPARIAVWLLLDRCRLLRLPSEWTSEMTTATDGGTNDLTSFTAHASLLSWSQPLQVRRTPRTGGAGACGFAPPPRCRNRRRKNKPAWRPFGRAEMQVQTNKLRAAKKQLLSCAQPMCGKFLRRQCAARFSDLEPEVPSVIPLVKDGSGQHRPRRARGGRRRGSVGARRRARPLRRPRRSRVHVPRRGRGDCAGDGDDPTWAAQSAALGGAAPRRRFDHRARPARPSRRR